MRVVLLSACLAIAGASPALAQLSSRVVVSGLTFPVAVVQDPTQPNVQFIVEQGGRIRIVQNGVLSASDFLDLTSVVLSGGERGLLGLAFAPDYATSRRFFVNFTRQPDGNTVIARFRRSVADPLRADPASRFDLRWVGNNAFIFQPFSNHNAGDLQFGSDGFLYIPLGDGGSGNDPDHRAQNPQELLGKTLRVDINVLDSNTQGYVVPADNPFVGNAGVLPQIWSFGLRNPFRTTVDLISRGGTGALVMGDVGQNAWEEVDYEPFGAGGRNYGWRNREGAHDNVTSLPPAFTPLTDPIIEYGRDVGQVITGGIVYRGADLGVPFWGRYFFADFGSQRIWSANLIVDPVTRAARAGEIVDHTAELGAAAISAFGIGASCQAYYVTYLTGQMRQIVSSRGIAAGCPTSPDPFLASGGGVFVNGGWVTRNDPLAAGAGIVGGGATAGTCVVPQPAPGWTCVNGGWLPPGFPGAAGAAPMPVALNPPPATGGTGGGTPPPPPPPTSCTTVQPVPTWVCVNGGWLPPDHPQAIAPGGGGAGGTPPPPPPPGPPATCLTPAPASNWVCVGGGWLPPGHPLAVAPPGGTGGTGGGTAPPGGTPPAGCTTPDPFASIGGGVCVGGGWLPRGHPLAGGG